MVAKMFRLFENNDLQGYQNEVVKILIVAHHPGVRQIMKIHIELEGDLMVIGEADNGLAGIELALQLKPDVAVIDQELPGMDGFDTTQRLHSVLPTIPVILLSLNDDKASQLQAQEAGAVDFVTKQSDPAILLNAIRQAAKLPG
jgi:DNA-binding NarL/FixJ family response regulator